jgi:hypothetical protein
MTPFEKAARDHAAAVKVIAEFLEEDGLYVAPRAVAAALLKRLGDAKLLVSKVTP